MMIKKGKAYANKRVKEDRPNGDFYSTPMSLIWVAKDIIEKEFDKNIDVLEPCSGDGAIVKPLIEMGYNVIENDLYRGGVDYLNNRFKQKQVITNPPFSLWDNFLTKSKDHADKILYIGRLNYLGTHSRNINGIWDNLKAVYCFDRYVDYQTPYREDGKFCVGAMATAWFLWDMNYQKEPIIKILDVQKYAKLGNYKKKGESNDD